MVLETSDVMTLINATRESGGIPISVNLMATTEWTQYGILMIITAISCLFAFIFLWDGYFKPVLGGLYAKYVFFKIFKITGRRILLVKHTTSGLFSQSMIDLNTVNGIEKAFKSFKGQPFDLILHTPGGYVFYAQILSKSIKQYKSETRAFVPLYSMSGGTMLALSCNSIFMGPFACLGPVDPQIGGLFSSGSARSYKEVIRRKGRRASDTSIQNAFVGEQYTKTIREETKKLLLNKTISTDSIEPISELLTDGTIEHAFQLDASKLSLMGMSVQPIDDNLQSLLLDIVLNDNIEGVLWY